MKSKEQIFYNGFSNIFFSMAKFLLSIFTKPQIYLGWILHIIFSFFLGVAGLFAYTVTICNENNCNNCNMKLE